MVNVTEIGEMGAYVTLLEYDNIEVRLHYASFPSPLHHFPTIFI